MALSDGSCGFMLQGVSQQAPRVQPEGHVLESINMLPDPNTGNTSRPGGALVGGWNLPSADDKSTTVVIGGNLVRITYDQATLQMRGYDGTAYTIQDPDGYIPLYLGTSDLKFLPRENEIIVLNRNRVVNTLTDTSGIIKDWAYVFNLGGQFDTTYKVRLTYSDGTVAVGEHKTPDNDGNDEWLRAEIIMEALKLSLEAHPNYKAATTTIVRQDEVLFIQNTNFGLNITARDGRGDTLIRAGSAMAETFADVPRYAKHNTVIRVEGERGTLADDVWLIFKSNTTSVTGNGFGSPGVWEETYDPDSATTFNRASMPHILTPHASLANTYVFRRGDWARRGAGNETSNPAPSFVGKRIRDVGEFQSRLWFCAGGYWCASRTDDNSSFWRRSATVLLATDPIDIKTNDSNDVELDYGVDYDKSLLLFSKNGQYVITGQGSISPNTASLVKATNFEMSSRARPTVAGQTVMLPYKARSFAGVNEMQPAENSAANFVESINKVTSKYIKGEIVEMVSSANANILLLYTTGAPRDVYVYNFLWEGNEKTQSAWHRWIFPHPIHHLYMKDSVLYVWTRDEQKIKCMEIRVDKPVDSVGYHASLDYKFEYTVDTEIGQITTNSPDYKFIAAGDGEEYRKGIEITPKSVSQTGSDTWTYYMPPGVPAQVLAGIPISIELRPVRPIPKDWRGNKDYVSTVVVNKFMVDFVDSGEFAVYMDTPYEGLLPMYTDVAFNMEDNPLDTLSLGIKTGTAEVPWGEDASIGKVVLKTDDVRPITILEVRWYGHVYKGQG